MNEEKFVLSGFADEIDDQLGTQLDVLNELGIDHIDVRNVDGVNVSNFDKTFAHSVKEQLNEAGFNVSSIGSPIGKISITDNFADHREQFEHVLELAKLFEADYVRVFSYYIPNGDNPVTHRKEVIRRMQIKTTLAAERDIVLFHENERDIYGATPERCRDILTTVDSDYLRMVFDPGNFVEVGVRPFPDALTQIIEFVEQLHVKDAVSVEEGREMQPAGEGEGNLPEILAALRDRGFRGYASLEPHLSQADEEDGFSGPEAYRTATKALVGLLDSIDAAYE